jgi:pyrroline-5-carboxylate reductase
MGEALLAGMLAKGVVEAENVTGVEAVRERGAEIAGKYNIKIAGDAREAVKHAEIVIIAVKPKDADAALKTFDGDAGRLVISICAGLKLDWFAARLPPNSPVVRVMPNTPALVGEGASAFCATKAVDARMRGWTTQIFGAVGKVVEVDDEKLMDAVTGLSGSGPAYVFTFIEALADGGVLMGLPRPLAVTLAAQTVLGAAAMALSGVAHTAELKDRVASPGGTTIEGLRALEAGGIRSAVIEAVAAATRRSRELGG